MNLKKTYFKVQVVLWQLCHIIVYCCIIVGIGVQRYLDGNMFVGLWFGIGRQWEWGGWGQSEVMCRCLGSTNMVT
jgi:hypothetical protein